MIFCIFIVTKNLKFTKRLNGPSYGCCFSEDTEQCIRFATFSLRNFSMASWIIKHPVSATRMRSTKVILPLIQDNVAIESRNSLCAAYGQLRGREEEELKRLH